MKTIAIDFDGVIHGYTDGWKDGSIYDGAVKGAIETINKLVYADYSVFILSTRSGKQIKKWLKDLSNPLLYIKMDDYLDIYHPFQSADDPDIQKYIQEVERSNSKLQFKVECIPMWTKFWNEKAKVGITNRKLPAHVYIDDRALVFKGDWEETFYEATKFKTYQEK